MPQTYIRAVGSDAAGTRSALLVSCSRTGPPRPGRTGRGGAGQRVTPVRLPSGNRADRSEPAVLDPAIVLDHRGRWRGVRRRARESRGGARRGGDAGATSAVAGPVAS